MDVRTGTSSPEQAMARLRAVPDGLDPEATEAAEDPTSSLKDTGGVEDLRADLALLRDAATLVTARQRLDGLLLQLTVQPFDRAAYCGLGSYLVRPGVRALAASERVSASMPWWWSS